MFDGRCYECGGKLMDYQSHAGDYDTVCSRCGFSDESGSFNRIPIWIWRFLTGWVAKKTQRMEEYSFQQLIDSQKRLLARIKSEVGPGHAYATLTEHPEYPLVLHLQEESMCNLEKRTNDLFARMGISRREKKFDGK